MTVQAIQNLDLYKCSLQDINKADKALRNYVLKLIKQGHSTANNFKGSDEYLIAAKLSSKVSRAKGGFDENGYKFASTTERPKRVPNAESVL